jgi:hypothetical protein
MMGPVIRPSPGAVPRRSRAREPITDDVSEQSVIAHETPTPVRSVLARVWRAITRSEPTVADIVTKPTRHTL